MRPPPGRAGEGGGTLDGSQPAPWEVLTLGGVAYRLAAHPDVPGLPHVHQGNQAIVYQLLAQDGAEPTDRRALKLFKPRYRLPALEPLANDLAIVAALPGLEVCRRTVLSPDQHADVLRAAPELTYSIVM